MKKKQLMGLLAMGIVIPSTAIASCNSAIASELKVKTPNVEAISRRDGSVYINSGGTTVQVPSRRTYRYWTPWRSWRLPWQSNYNSIRSNCRHSSYQSTSRVTESSSQIIQSSISSNTCK